MLKSYWFPAAYHLASRRTRRCHDVVSVPKLQKFSHGGQHVVGFSWEEAVQLVVRCQCQSGCGVQSACGAARCVCGNLVNALKLLANQPKDGDSPIQSIVAGFCERSRNSITEGMRHFTEEQKTVQQKRAEVCAALQYGASFHCLVEEWKDYDELKLKPKEKLTVVGPEKRAKRNTERSGVLRPTKYRCLRCERGIKYMKHQRTMHGPTCLSKFLGKW